MRYALCIAVVAVTSVAQPAPSVLAHIDTGKLKGEPTQLSWSPDGSQFFLQTSERDGSGNLKKPRFFLVTPGSDAPSSVAQPPAWATEYWNWKSYKMPPNASAPEIEVSQGTRTGTATESAMGGSLSASGEGMSAGGGSGTSLDQAAMRAQQQERKRVVTLRLQDEVIGEFVDQQPLPGYTFSWNPKPPVMLAYRNATGHLAIMKGRGDKHEIPGTKDVILPAWSPDGAKIAYLERVGKNKYDLLVVDAR